MRAVIAGAGIAGLTAALTLSRIGWQVTLVERRTGFAEPGAGIQLSPNASRILIELGLGPALRRIAGIPDRVVIREAASGRTIGSVALGTAMSERHGAPYLVVARADLQTLLLDAVRSLGVPLMLGRRATALASREADAALTLATESGAESTLEADLIVAADGLWSSCRAAMGLAAPRHAGYAAWRATVPADSLPSGLDASETGLWLGRLVHVVHYPIALGARVNIVAVERRAEPVESWSAPGEPGDIRAAFARAAPALQGLIAGPEEWRIWSLHDAPAIPMARGRLALIGDAAHPVLPFLAQGGALAIEDSADLAAALAGIPSPQVPAALARYAAARRRRVARVQAEARRNGRVYHLAGPAAWARDLVIARLGPAGMAARYDWLYGWRPSGTAPDA